MYQFDFSNDSIVFHDLNLVYEYLSELSLHTFFTEFQRYHDVSVSFIRLAKTYEEGADAPTLRGFVISLYFAWNCMGLEVHF